MQHKVKLTVIDKKLYRNFRHSIVRIRSLEPVLCMR